MGCGRDEQQFYTTGRLSPNFTSPDCSHTHASSYNCKVGDQDNENVPTRPPIELLDETDRNSFWEEDFLRQKTINDHLYYTTTGGVCVTNSIDCTGEW